MEDCPNSQTPGGSIPCPSESGGSVTPSEAVHVTLHVQEIDDAAMLAVDGVGSPFLKALEQLVQAHKDSLAGSTVCCTPRVAMPRGVTTPRGVPETVGFPHPSIDAFTPRSLHTQSAPGDMPARPQNNPPTQAMVGVHDHDEPWHPTEANREMRHSHLTAPAASTSSQPTDFFRNVVRRQTTGPSLESSSPSRSKSFFSSGPLGPDSCEVLAQSETVEAASSHYRKLFSLAGASEDFVERCADRPAKMSLRSQIHKQIEHDRWSRFTQESGLDGAPVDYSDALSYEDIIKEGRVSANESSPWIPRDRFSTWVRTLVQHVFFESIFATLIILNTLTIAVEVQYSGMDSGYDIGYHSSTASAADAWPGAKEALGIIELIFGTLFTLELVLKVVAFRLGVFSSCWNVFDGTIVTLWLTYQIISIAFLNPTLLRFCRLMRVMRVVRLFKWIQALDSLSILVNSIRASLSVMVWAFLLIFSMITLSALIANYFILAFLQDESIPVQQRREVYRFFGTFTRSAVSMFEVTLGNFGPVMRSLTENVDEIWGIFFILYKAVAGFSVVTVINGVFLHETFGVADSDPDLMVITARRQQQAHLQKMSRLFDSADRTGVGTLTFLQFTKLMADPFVQTWLAAYELNVVDVALLFNLCDDGDGHLSANELMTGIARLKGSARSLDLHGLMLEVEGVTASLADLTRDFHNSQPRTLIRDPRHESIGGDANEQTATADAFPSEASGWTKILAASGTA